MPVGFGQTSITQIEIPDFQPSPAVVDDYTLSTLLRYKTRTLWHLILHRNELYKSWVIPKAHNKSRLIHAPQGNMKLALRNLNRHMLNPLQEPLGEHVSAYRKERSIKTAVMQHIRACPICPKYGTFIKIDLKDFFHSTKKSWVRDCFKKLGYTHYVSDLISNLTTVSLGPEGTRKKDVIPQGSPASGAICNLVADQRLDGDINSYLAELNQAGHLQAPWDWRYSRYSDDLIFTCGELLSKEAKSEVVSRLRYIIHSCGYRVNPKKIRTPHSYFRKKVLGIVINRKPNIPKEDYRKLRAIVHNCNTRGFDTQYEKAGKKNVAALMDYLQGKIGFVQFVNPEKGAKLMLEFQTAKANWEKTHG
jgi:RNA-directed DNA polymerase